MTDSHIIRAAGILFRSKSGKMLVVKRSDEGDASGQWAFPGGKIEAGETLEQAAIRECYEETGYKPESAGKFLMRRVKNGVDFTTFICDCDEEWIPVLNEEHTAHAWMAPSDLLGGAM